MQEHGGKLRGGGAGGPPGANRGAGGADEKQEIRLIRKGSI